MKTSRQLLVLLGLTLTTAVILRISHGPPNRILACDPAKLKSDERCLSQLPADGQGVLWVDARPRALWQKNGMPGSILWNLEPGEDMHAFEADAVPRIASSSLVVVYCSDEHCGISRQVAGHIRDLGLGPEVVVLHGGWSTLRDAGKTPLP